MIFYSISSTQYLLKLNIKKIVHCANFPQKLFDKKKFHNNKKKVLKRASIKSNIMKHLYFSTNITHYYYHYIIKFAKPPPRVCHSFNEKKPAKKDAGRIPETETHSKKTRWKSIVFKYHIKHTLRWWTNSLCEIH